MRGIKWAKRRRSREFETTQAASDADAGGGGLAFSLTAQTQTRTHKTAGANNEVIPRGGASARVLEAKPSPFLIFLRRFAKK